MSDLTIAQKLDEKIPREAVSTRDAGNGRTLDYLSGYYVINRLNKVLGAGNWAYAADASLVHQGVISRGGSDTHTVHYLAKVRLVVTIGNKPTEFHDYGYGDGTDKVNPGKAHELAVKEAVTDGIKRCAKNLGMSFGLALYSKDQENVDDGPSELELKPRTVFTRNDGAGKEALPGRTTAPTPVQKAVSESSKKETLLKKISVSSKVIVDSKRDTQENILKMLESYGVKTKEQLTEEQATGLAAKLEEMLK